MPKSWYKVTMPLNLSISSHLPFVSTPLVMYTVSSILNMRKTVETDTRLINGLCLIAIYIRVFIIPHR